MDLGEMQYERCSMIVNIQLGTLHFIIKFSLEATQAMIYD